MLADEAEKEKITKEGDPELEITFHRNSEKYPKIQMSYYMYDETYDLVDVNGNSYFLVKAEDVENLIKSVKKTF